MSEEIVDSQTARINPKLKAFLKLIPAICFCGVIFYLSSLSQPLPTHSDFEPTEFLYNPYLLHVVEYAILGFLLAFGLYKSLHPVYYIAMGIAYGVSDEIHQLYVPSRYFDYLDILMNAIGVVIGALGFLLIFFLLKRVKSTSFSLD